MQEFTKSGQPKNSILETSRLQIDVASSKGEVLSEQGLCSDY